MADNTKPCSKCKKVLPLTDFVKARKLANGDQGYRSFCMPCRNREARNTKPFDYTKNPVNSKKCNKCNKVLSIEHFFKQRVRSDGYRNICKPCMGFTMPEILPEGMKRCARCNKVLSKTKFNRDSRKDKSLIAKDGLKSYCSTCQAEYRKEWLEENKEEYNEKRKAPHSVHRANMLRRKRWLEDEEYKKKKSNEHKANMQNPEFRAKVIINRRARNKERYETDTSYNIKRKIASNIRTAFRLFSTTGKIQSARKYNISYKAIINKLGSPPTDGYDIDHIIPVSLFDHDDKEQVRLCWTPENLQWMEHIENLSKSDSFSENMEDYPEELHKHWKVAYKNYLNKKGE